jgi:hypothetical protein
VLKRIDRAKVNKLIAGLLERVKKINADNNLCHFINEIRLFGSTMDDKTESFGDIDVCYVMARRKVPPDQKSWTDWMPGLPRRMTFNLKHLFSDAS